MSLFSFFSKRSKTDEIQNPCPVPVEDTASPRALHDFLNRDNIPAMSISTFFAAVNIVSNSIAMMDWKYKDKEGNELSETNYLYHLFEDSELTRFNIVKNVIQDLILYGNGFIFIERDRETGRPKTLKYSPFHQTAIWYNAATNKVKYWNYIYSRDWDDGTNYLHFFTNTDNGFLGIGAIKYAYNAIDIASTVQQTTESYYKTQGQTFGIVTPNGQLALPPGNKEAQLTKLEASWRNTFSKPNRGTVFFPSDLKYIPLSTSARDNTLIESREYNAVEVGRFIANINPVVLGDLRHNTYGTLSEAQKEFIIRSLAPYVKCLEDEMNRKLIMPSKWNKQFVDLDEYSILATDQEKQANCIKTLTGGSPVMSINEARSILNLPPIDDGDKLIIPYSKVADNTIGNTNDKNIEEKEDGN